MLSRKYYIMIAKCIKDSKLNRIEFDKATSKGGLIDLLCIEFEKDNKSFNDTKFVEACIDD